MQINLIKKINLFNNIVATLLITLTFLTGCNNAGIGGSANNPSPETNTTYLVKPTGQYGVGFKDFHFQDNSRCPDVYYSEKTAVDFSSDNPNHCREIIARVYYPTDEAISLGSPYYKPQLLATANELKEIVQHAGGTINPDFDQLYSLKSYSHENAQVSAYGKFPVVIYGPGNGDSVQKFENTITNLVSHGYVVIGVNSLFTTGYIDLPNGHMLTEQYDNNDTNNLSSRKDDIIYIDQHELSNINQSLSNIMDITNIGIMGHSEGANVTELLAQDNKYGFKAAITTEADVHPYFEPFTMPFMHILSASRYWSAKYILKKIDYLPRYKLNTNNYLVGLVANQEKLINSDNPLPNTHDGFTDDVTLQYTRAFQITTPLFEEAFKKLFGISSFNPYGSGDGYQNAATINTYVVHFFDTFLKGRTDSAFGGNECNTLDPNTMIVCGGNPTVIFPNNEASAQTKQI